MSINRIIAALIFFLIINSISTSAQSSNLYNTEEQLITSKNVADTFHVFVSVPDDYVTSGKSYPVLYVLDGDIAFGMAASVSRYLQIGGNIPELIVVGIGYGSIDKTAGNKRNRDYRPVEEGGAENFLSFFKEELIPFIDSTYRTIPGNRTINGYSSGGLYALYTLFTEPETFSKYIVGSPYLVWNNYSIYDYQEKALDKIGDKKINLFISVGSEESEAKYFNPIDELVIKLQERNYSGLRLDTKVFDGSTHLMGPPEAITHGLLSVFGKD
jgi:predicted alpha/beta superfamily hydrolase